MANESDGGYHAIKGFLYQFDKALIEVLMNPDSQVCVEHRQDIDYQDFVIQVKHKETQEYRNYKIKKPVQQLIEMFKTDQTQKFCLYCHFVDKAPLKWTPNVSELNEILGDQADNYTAFLKEKFIQGFFIQFSENFDDQFSQVIGLIKSNFSLPDEDKAYYYHSLLRSKLLDISIQSKSERKITRHDLDKFIGDAEKTVFYTAYSKYLDQDKYERLVKKEFFTFRTANIENFERLFIIQCDESIAYIELNRIVNLLNHKYFKVGKSPQPYLCFDNLDDQKLITLKQDLIDQGIIFDDGTYFNGDRFRLDRIIEKRLLDDKTAIKIVNREFLDRVITKVKFHEVYQFYISSPIALTIEHKHIKIQILETKQVARMLS